MLNYYTTKLDRIKRKIDRIKSKGEEITQNENTALLIAEAEKRLLEEFIEDLQEIEKGEA